MNLFKSLAEIEPIARFAEHGGEGPIHFRRIFSRPEFATPIDFIDYTRIPPGSSIGRHEHSGNEEMYFIVEGQPLVRLNGEERRLQKGSFAIVRDGEWHELINDRDEVAEILVIQVSGVH